MLSYVIICYHMLSYVIMIFDFPTTAPAIKRGYHCFFFRDSVATLEANTVYACKLYAGNESDRLLPAGP